MNRTVRTDRNGRFTITFPGGEGDYFLTATMIGYQPKRFEVRRTADQDILVADVQLSRMTMLDTVRAVAERDRVNRNDRTPDVSGTEQSASSAAVPADQQGDLNAIAGTIPGVTPILDAAGDPAGFSVLGLSADQNSTTLNGANFGSSTLPRDAQVATFARHRPLRREPRRLQWRATQRTQRQRIELHPSQQQPELRRARAAVDRSRRARPRAAVQEPLARRLRLRPGRLRQVVLQLRLSARASRERSAHAAQHRSHRLPGDRRGRRLRDAAAPIAQAQGIPLTNGATPANRLRDQGSLFGSFNFTPPNSSKRHDVRPRPERELEPADAGEQLTTELPAHSGDRTNWGAGAQLQHTTYLKQILLSETTLSVGGNRNYGDPYTLLPNGSVLVNSSFQDGTSGVRTLGFGGSSNLSTSSSGLTTELQNQISWFSRNNKHRLKLSSELQYDGYHQDQTTNLLGTFGYNSLADLQANRPAFFTRSLLNRIQSAGAVTAALALGDSYRRTSNLQIQYGLRLDANRFNAVPE